MPLLPVACRVRQMLEQSATLAAAAGQEEPLQRQLGGLPPPVATYLQDALGGLRPGAQNKCVGGRSDAQAEVLQLRAAPVP